MFDHKHRVISTFVQSIDDYHDIVENCGHFQNQVSQFHNTVRFSRPSLLVMYVVQLLELLETMFLLQSYLLYEGG